MAAIYSVVYPELVEVLLIFFADDFQFNRIPSPRKKGFALKPGCSFAKFNICNAFTLVKKSNFQNLNHNHLSIIIYNNIWKSL